MAINEKYVGGRFDDFLKELRIYDEVIELVAKKRLAIRVDREMKKKKIAKHHG